MKREEKVKTYKVEVVCANCQFKKVLTIPFRITVGETPCPQCGCDELEPFKIRTLGGLPATVGDQ